VKEKQGEVDEDVKVRGSSTGMMFAITQLIKERRYAISGIGVFGKAISRAAAAPHIREVLLKETY
jgi:hypothetical protein